MIHTSFTNYRKKEAAILTKSANLFGNEILLYCSHSSKEFLEGLGLEFKWRHCPLADKEEKIDVFSTEAKSAFFRQKYGNFEATIRDFGEATYVGTDVIFADHLQPFSHNYDLALTPHFISSEKEKVFGRYNVDFVWTNTPKLVAWLARNMNRSIHSDQFPYDFAHEEFVVKELDMGYNMGWYRLSLEHNRPENVQKRLAAIQSKEDGIYIGEEKIKFFHTHMIHEGEYGYCNWFNIYILHLLREGLAPHQELVRFIESLC